MTEKELIEGCLQQDRLCQSELYKRYFSLMTSIAMRYCRSEEEVLQSVNYGFLKVLQNLSAYKEEYALATWIRRILVNHLIDEYRRQSRDLKSISLEVAEIPETGGEINLAEYRFSEVQLRKMLEKLPRVTQTVFNLFAIEGYKHGEIAEALGISRGTSKWHVAEARKKLSAMLEEYQKEDERIKKALI